MSKTKNKTAVVVIPTYNEAKTIGRLIDQLFTDVFPEVRGWKISVLIVDGQSPDGTAELVRQKQTQYENLELLVEKKKEGIGAAYVKGFKYAMKNMNADVVMEFDGDFQHPPDRIPVMLKEIDNGYDYVLGSRRVKGGSSPIGWGFKRVFLSRAGGFATRFILFFPGKLFFKLTDPTTGLRASRVKGFVDQMDMENLYTTGFAYKFEFLYKMVDLGAKVKEIPLKFQVRREGESKMTAETVKNAFKIIFQLRWHDKDSQRFIKFGIVGFIGYIVNATGLAVFARISLPEFLVWLLATEMAIISNFIWNNLWTFKEKQFKTVREITGKFLQFNLTSAGALLIQTAVGTVLTSLFGPEYRQLYLPLIIVLLIIPYNWLMYNKIIWKKK